MMDTRSQLVTDARQIAQHIGYTNLVNGLQPVDALVRKYRHELLDELPEALAQKSLLDGYGEAADVLYYAACLDEQEQGANWWVNGLQALLPEIDRVKAQAAALAKYNWRASGKNNKDEQYELALIAEAIREKN